MNNLNNLNQVLRNFKIKGKAVDYYSNNSYSYYDIQLNIDGKVKDLYRYSDEISLALKCNGKPSIKVLHSQGIIRLEFINNNSETLKLFDYIDNNNLPKGELICLLGKSVNNEKVWMNLTDNPHMLIAGASGSGKTTLIHNIIANLINYNDIQLFLIDTKNVEFEKYNKLKIPTFLATSYSEADQMIQSLIDIMESNFQLLRNGYSYNKIKNTILIIDEFADLIFQDENNNFHKKLCSLSQKCRAAKIHIILATQRPSVKVLNGDIKVNFPARISCRVGSHIDSKVILDASGAQNLMGQGDALLKDNSRNMERFQIAYTEPNEIIKYFGK